MFVDRLASRTWCAARPSCCDGASVPRAKLAHARAELLADLGRKNHELEAFSYSVSHDLRAPLRAIDGFFHALLADHAAALDDQGQDYLHRVRAAASRMAQIIDDLIDLSRVVRTEITRDPVDLSAIAREVIAGLRAAQPEREVDVFEIRDRVTVRGDARLLRLALENLLSNAWKFTARTQGARSSSTPSSCPPRTVCRIRDNGVGFDMAEAQKLFRPFRRLHDRGEYPGTGIGLATVQRVVARHGGGCGQAAPGKGAMFAFALPVMAGVRRGRSRRRDAGGNGSPSNEPDEEATKRQEISENGPVRRSIARTVIRSSTGSGSSMMRVARWSWPHRRSGLWCVPNTPTRPSRPAAASARSISPRQ